VKPRNARLDLSRSLGRMSQLQWGRGREAAERAAVGTASFLDAMLQWGRGREAAERISRVASRQWGDMLQWGRGREAAER